MLYCTDTDTDRFRLHQIVLLPSKKKDLDNQIIHIWAGVIWFYPNLQFNLVDAIRENRGRMFQIDWQVKFIASKMINLNLTTRCLSFFCKFCTTLTNFKTVTRSGCIVCHEMWPFWNGLLFIAAMILLHVNHYVLLSINSSWIFLQYSKLNLCRSSQST